MAEMLQDISTPCDLGGKQGNNGHTKWWRGYKLDLDVADRSSPISALITSASVHDSQVAIPLIHKTPTGFAAFAGEDKILTDRRVVR